MKTQLQLLITIPGVIFERMQCDCMASKKAKASTNVHWHDNENKGTLLGGMHNLCWLDWGETDVDDAGLKHVAEHRDNVKVLHLQAKRCSKLNCVENGFGYFHLQSLVDQIC